MTPQVRLEDWPLASLSWEELTQTDGALCLPYSCLELGLGWGLGWWSQGHKALSVLEISHSTASVVLSESKNRPSP